MEKLDKVIAGLECCGVAKSNQDACLVGCPYYGGRSGKKVCLDFLMKDALGLLREYRIVKAERDFAVGIAEAYGEYVEATLEQEVSE
jgi:hypothetical protein